MKITLIYDNEAWDPELVADWGFACLIEPGDGRRLLFDTGAKGPVLLGNMAKLGIDPGTIPMVFISHAHWDHTGGLPAFLQHNPKAEVFLPASCPPPPGAAKIVAVKGPQEILPLFWSTGELNGGEQSLVADTGRGLVVVSGCAHPGVENILKAAARFGRVTALVGGLHGFREFELLRDLTLICPCHCTQRIAEIRQRYPETSVAGGAGKVLEL
jgi:7,8-dihydropterin-6-yl-methyl-4-(beta-D-ribofuranosyl)aminobenzene 5'-phosphate synthase